MAHKKAGGSSRNGRDSHSKRLGVKAYGGEAIRAGGDHRPPARHARFIAGVNVGIGKDHTLFALVDGKVAVQHQGQRQDAQSSASCRRPVATARSATSNTRSDLQPCGRRISGRAAAARMFT